MLDLDDLINGIRNHRPVFHSERDFQLELGWFLKSAGFAVFAERPVGAAKIDLVAYRKKEVLLVELKYRTAELMIRAHGESFRLRTHGAQDEARYYARIDVQRLEDAVFHQDVSDGAAAGLMVLLTNDSLLWEDVADSKRADREFSIGTALLQAQPRWREGPRGTVPRWTQKTKYRDAKALRESYSVNWRDYSEPAQTMANGKFRIATIVVSQ